MKKIALVLITLLGLGAYAQPDCPDYGWGSEPVQDPESCCILFEMLPSTPDFPWNFWIVTADGVNYTNADNPISFPICFEEAGVENVVVTYIDALGVTLCENNWTVTVENGCGPPCDECIEVEEITITGEDACDYEFTMNYTIDPSCEEITIISRTWDFGYPFGTGSGITASTTFPEDGTYTVTGTIEYTVDWDDEPCTQKQSIDVNVIGCSEIDCSSFDLIEISGNDMTVELPTNGLCKDPSYVISIKEFDSGDPFELVTFTTEEVAPGVLEATLIDLEECTPYQIQVELLCGEVSLGTCINDESWITDCPEPCAGCVILDGIDIIEEDRCEYTFEADFNISADCEGITIDAINWSFGFDGPEGRASGETVDATFLCSGTYRVTATILYSNATGDECIARVSRLIEVTGCSKECESCYIDACINTLYDLFFLDLTDCEYVFIFDHVEGDCGELIYTSYDWDFGHPDGFESTDSHLNTHTFPGDGTYTVTLTLWYYIVEEDAFGSCTITTEIEVTGCEGKPAHKMVESPGNAFSNSPFKIITAPNPADDNVTITVLDPTKSSVKDEFSLIIYDINGRVVYRGLTVLGSETRIDVSTFESGLYFYEILDENSVILKEKLLIK